MFISIAMSRVVPVLGGVFKGWLGVEGTDGTGMSVEGGRNEFGYLMDRFGGLVRAADRELYLMLQTELHSVHPHSPPSPTSSNPTAPLKPITIPAPAVMETLMHEMENMIIENKLKKEAPLRSVWEGAVSRGRERERAVSICLGNGSVEVPLFWKPAEKVEVGERIGCPKELPSPRPSPSPPPSSLPGIGVRRGSSFVRARSVSY